MSYSPFTKHAFSSWKLASLVNIQFAVQWILSISLSLSFHDHSGHHLLALSLHLPTSTQIPSNFIPTTPVTRCQNGNPLLQITQVPWFPPIIHDLLSIPIFLSYKDTTRTTSSGVDILWVPICDPAPYLYTISSLSDLPSPSMPPTSTSDPYNNYPPVWWTWPTPPHSFSEIPRPMANYVSGSDLLNYLR